MLVNGIEDALPCCPSADAETLELNPGPVLPLSSTDERCDPGRTVVVEWWAVSDATEARCTKIVEGEVIASDTLPLVIVPEPGFLGFLVCLILIAYWAHRGCGVREY